MFDETGPRSRREVIARFDELAEQMLERWQQRTPTPESADWMDQIATAVRIENQAVAAQLAAIGGLFRYRLSQCSETEDWAVDTMDAVAAEVAAGLRISQGLATDRVHYARAMRERLPKTAEVFTAGDIDYRAFTTIVSRTDLIVDPDALARVDAAGSGQRGALAVADAGPTGGQGRCDRGPRGRRRGAPAQRTPRGARDLDRRRRRRDLPDHAAACSPSTPTP